MYENMYYFHPYLTLVDEKFSVLITGLITGLAFCLPLLFALVQPVKEPIKTEIIRLSTDL